MFGGATIYSIHEADWPKREGLHEIFWRALGYIPLYIRRATWYYTTAHWAPCFFKAVLLNTEISSTTLLQRQYASILTVELALLLTVDC